MKISFEIDEQDYRNAVCLGWEERFEEVLKPEELNLFPNAIDICCAISVIDDLKIQRVEYS